MFVKIGMGVRPLEFSPKSYTFNSLKSLLINRWTLKIWCETMNLRDYVTSHRPTICQCPYELHTTFVCRGYHLIVPPSISGHMNYPCCHMTMAMRTIWFYVRRKWRIERLYNSCALQSKPFQSCFIHSVYDCAVESIAEGCNGEQRGNLSSELEINNSVYCMGTE